MSTTPSTMELSSTGVCVCVFPSFSHRSIVALILAQYFSPSPCCFLVAMVKAQRQTVVSGSCGFTVRQYLMGMTESTVLMMFKKTE